MAQQPKTLPFGKFKVFVGDGATPTEGFDAPCGFTQKALQLSAETNTQAIPDCVDPDAPAWQAREVSTLSANVSGSGVIAMEDYETWRQWFLSAAGKNIRVQFDSAAANGGGYWQGRAVLTSLQHNANLGNKAELSVTMESDGAWDWTDAPA